MSECLMTKSITYNDFFPYSTKRDGQEKMMECIENAVREGKHICCEAPNGFGKTCTTLSGILPWVCENRGKIVYCARTHKQLDRVIEELSEIEQRSKVSGVSFRGRRHMCLNPFVKDARGGVPVPISEVCGQLKAERQCAYYEKLRGKDPHDLLKEMPSRAMSAPDIVRFAEPRHMCPYELAKMLAKEADVVALSYLYIFDEFIMSMFIPELTPDTSSVVLVQDEAHNVPSTALDTASDSLTVGIVRQAMREGTTYNDDISKSFSKTLAKIILERSTNMKDNEEVRIDPIALYSEVLDDAKLGADDEPLKHMKEEGIRRRIEMLKHGKFPRSAIYRVSDFMLRWLRNADREDYAFLLVSKRGYGESRRLSLDMVALDPVNVTRNILSIIRSSVAISGTISPLDAYSEMLGFDDDSYKEEFQSPFATKNRIGIIVDGLDTSYNSRTDEMYEQMVDHCVEVVRATPGNIGIFTTSYFVAQCLRKAGLEDRLDKILFVENPGMKGTENDEMVSRFKKASTRGGAVLLGVQGGRNSEGGDFPGPTMESVIVVGVPYAIPTPRMDALIEYFDSRFNGKGRDYAYVLPAMTRAIQAAGRPVRRLDDRGAIVMLDQRFATPYLKRFLPSYLKEIMQVFPNEPKTVGRRIQEFFEDKR